jgi:phosphopantothenoylcysteine decarboxylase/phosphopantothenate--cysteine ligase
MGYALAAAAQKRGAKVTLVSAPASLKPPVGVDLLAVESAEEMLGACRDRFLETNIVIMAAAVADFRPEKYQEQKIKKGNGVPEIILKPTPDILKELAALRTRQYIVGFAAETQDLIGNARKKLQGKNLDLMVANDVSQGIFGSDNTSILIMDAEEQIRRYEGITKVEAAGFILDAVLER